MLKRLRRKSSASPTSSPEVPEQSSSRWNLLRRKSKTPDEFRSEVDGSPDTSAPSVSQSEGNSPLSSSSNLTPSNVRGRGYSPLSDTHSPMSQKPDTGSLNSPNSESPATSMSTKLADGKVPSVTRRTLSFDDRRDKRDSTPASVYFTPPETPEFGSPQLSPTPKGENEEKAPRASQSAARASESIASPPRQDSPLSSKSQSVSDGAGAGAHVSTERKVVEASRHVPPPALADGLSESKDEPDAAAARPFSPTDTDSDRSPVDPGDLVEPISISPSEDDLENLRRRRREAERTPSPKPASREAVAGSEGTANPGSGREQGVDGSGASEGTEGHVLDPVSPRGETSAAMSLRGNREAETNHVSESEGDDADGAADVVVDDADGVVGGTDGATTVEGGTDGAVDVEGGTDGTADDAGEPWADVLASEVVTRWIKANEDESDHGEEEPGAVGEEPGAVGGDGKTSGDGAPDAISGATEPSDTIGAGPAEPLTKTTSPPVPMLQAESSDGTVAEGSGGGSGSAGGDGTVAEGSGGGSDGNCGSGTAGGDGGTGADVDDNADAADTGLHNDGGDGEASPSVRHGVRRTLSETFPAESSAPIALGGILLQQEVSSADARTDGSPKRRRLSASEWKSVSPCGLGSPTAAVSPGHAGKLSPRPLSKSMKKRKRRYRKGVVTSSQNPLGPHSAYRQHGSSKTRLSEVVLLPDGRFALRSKDEVELAAEDLVRRLQSQLREDSSGTEEYSTDESPFRSRRNAGGDSGDEKSIPGSPLNPTSGRETSRRVRRAPPEGSHSDCGSDSDSQSRSQARRRRSRSHRSGSHRSGSDSDVSSNDGSSACDSELDGAEGTDATNKDKRLVGADTAETELGGANSGVSPSRGVPDDSALSAETTETGGQDGLSPRGEPSECVAPAAVAVAAGVVGQGGHTAAGKDEARPGEGVGERSGEGNGTERLGDGRKDSVGGGEPQEAEGKEGAASPRRRNVDDGGVGGTRSAGRSEVGDGQDRGAEKKSPVVGSSPAEAAVSSPFMERSMSTDSSFILKTMEIVGKIDFDGEGEECNLSDSRKKRDMAELTGGLRPMDAMDAPAVPRPVLEALERSPHGRAVLRSPASGRAHSDDEVGTGDANSFGRPDEEIISLDVSGCEWTDGGYVVYYVEAYSPHKRVSVSRRFSQFEKFHQDMEEKGASLPELPWKRGFWGRAARLFLPDPNFPTLRSKQLSDYLHKLMEVEFHGRKLVDTPEFRSFVGLATSEPRGSLPASIS
eukprot:Rmarinus@m.26547